MDILPLTSRDDQIIDLVLMQDGASLGVLKRAWKLSITASSRHETPISALYVPSPLWHLDHENGLVLPVAVALHTLEDHQVEFDYVLNRSGIRDKYYPEETLFSKFIGDIAFYVLAMRWLIDKRA